MELRVRNSQGMTVLELMVILIIIGIGSTLIYPGFTAYFQLIDLRNSSNILRNQLQTARLRAISNSDLHCGVHFAVDSTPQMSMIFYDVDASNTFSTGDELYMSPEIISDKCLLYIDGGDNPITDQVVIFRGDGSAKNGGRVKIISKDSVRTRTLDVLASTGRIKVIE